MPKLGLDRQQLARFFQNNAEAIRAFEQVFDSAATTPTTIEEAAAVAVSAAVVANQALSMLSQYAELLEQLGTAPVAAAAREADNFTPAMSLGTVSQQNADDIAISGGTIANVAITGSSLDASPIGATTRSTGAFTSVNANLTILSTAATQHSVRCFGGLVSGAKTYANLLCGPAAASQQSGQFGYVYDSATPAASFFHLTTYGAAEGSTFSVDTAGNTKIAGFGCNGKVPQAAAPSGGAVASTAATNVSPFGYTTAAQADAIVSRLNTIQAALIANGIMS